MVTRGQGLRTVVIGSTGAWSSIFTLAPPHLARPSAMAEQLKRTPRRPVAREGRGERKGGSFLLPLVPTCSSRARSLVPSLCLCQGCDLKSAVLFSTSPEDKCPGHACPQRLLPFLPAPPAGHHLYFCQSPYKFCQIPKGRGHPASPSLWIQHLA